jgi:hypothetical protein
VTSFATSSLLAALGALAPLGAFAPPGALAPLGVRAAFADPAGEPSAPRDVVAVQVHVGIATAPFDPMALPEAKGQAFVLIVEGMHAVSSDVVVGLRAPAVLASVAQPAGSYVDAATLGNLQLRAAYRALARRAERTELALVAGIDVGAPLAGHSAALMPNRALAIADGVEGRAHPELFTPGVVPASPFVDLALASTPWRVDATLRLPLLVRISDADLPEGARTHALGLAAAAEADARRQLTRRLALVVAAQLFVDLAPAVDRVRPTSTLQDLERVTLGVRIGSRAELMIDLQAALGGDLGGSTFGGGMRAIMNLP